MLTSSVCDFFFGSFFENLFLTHFLKGIFFLATFDFKKKTPLNNFPLFLPNQKWLRTQRHLGVGGLDHLLSSLGGLFGVNWAANCLERNGCFQK